MSSTHSPHNGTKEVDHQRSQTGSEKTVIMGEKVGLGLETSPGRRAEDISGCCLYTKVAVTSDPHHDLTIARIPGVLVSTLIFQGVESPEAGWVGREKGLLM